MKIALNLGCGLKPIPADTLQGGSWTVINHDITWHHPYINAMWDLNRLPWPWTTDSLSLVIAHSVLEHLNVTLVQSINECWRILKPQGRLDVKLPLWDHDISHDDPTHRWTVGRNILERFDPDSGRFWVDYAGIYGMKPWRLVEKRIGGSSLYGILEKRA